MADILKPGTVDSGFKFLGGDPSSPTSWEPVGLKIGTLDEGYRFKGGDPNDQTSWEKAPERSYLGASAVSGGRTLLAAGAKLIEEFNPFTTSEQEAAVLYKDNPEKLQEFTEKSASAILSRFAQEQTRRAREAMEEVRPSEKGLISGQQLDKLEYATLDPEKAAYLSPTRVAGDVLQSLPTTIALAASAYLTKGRSATAFQQAEASALARGVAAEEAKQIARAEALKVAANTMATTGAVGEGAIGYAQQANQTLDEIKRMSDEEWEKSTAYKSLLDEGYAPEAAKTLLGAQAAERAGAMAGAVDAATNLIGGKVLGRVIGEGGALGARTAKGFATEAATETVQSAGEQLGANIAMQPITPGLDITKGVLEAAVAGGVVGGVTGGGVSAIFGSRQRPESQILDDLNKAKDINSATAAANELAGSLDTLTAATTEYLTPQTPTLTPDQSLELAAAKGAMQRAGSLDLGAGPVVSAPAADRMAAAEVALREVEANQGVATPAQAAIIDAAFPGRKMYDSVALGGAAPAPTGGVIKVPEVRVPRETFVQGATEAANAEGFAELQARQQAAAAAAPAVEVPAAPTPPAATSVIQAFATPAAQRTAEQKVTLNIANQAYPAEDLEVMQLAATAPFKLDATQKVRLQSLRQETGPVLSPERTPQLVEALAVTPVLRTPEQQQVVSQARDTMPAEDFEILRVGAMDPAMLEPAQVPRFEALSQQAAVTQPVPQQAPVPAAPQAATPTLATPEFVAQMASTPERPFTAADVQVVDTNTLEGIEKQNFRLINQISRVFGKNVVVFDGLAGMQADGFVNPQDTNTIFLNRNSQMPHIAVFGHEMLHLLRRDSPDAYNAFASVVEKNLDEEGRSAFKAEYGETGEVLEELSADLMGNRFRDANFWTETFNEIAAQQGAPQARSVIAKLAGALYNAVDKAVAALRGQGFRADQYVKDLNQIKIAAKTALKTYAEQRRIPAMQMELEVAKASKTIDTVSKANIGVTNEPTGIPSLLSPTRPDRSGLVGERGGEAAAIPEFGTDSGRAGSIRVQGVHYSHDQLASVDGNRYGSNVSKDRGAEAGRVRAAKDRRITKRGYFYINTGKGISPEEGVGSVAHTAVLGNMYDPATGVIKANDLNDFESAVLDAGFDGYINRERGMAVVLDNKQVPVIPSDGTAEVVPAPKSETVTSQLVKMRSLPAGELSRERWGQVLKTVAPEIHAQLEPTGAFQGEERVYKNQLAPQLSRKREYKMALEKEERQVGKAAALTKEESNAIVASGKELGLTPGRIAELTKAAREVKKQYPQSAGWAPLKLVGLDKDGDLKWQETPYAFNRPPGVARAPAKIDANWLGKVADSFYSLVKDIYDRAAAGDKNAQIIIGHKTWYRNVADTLRREYGGFGDTLADLLGATSPNTPVDTNWRFSVNILRRFVRGEFDAELQKFDDYIRAGGVASKYPAADKIRQVSGKLYGMNSGNAMKALLDVWRVIETGTAPKARNFALNLIGQSNIATIDVWAARMLRRAANLIRGVNLPRIAPPAEGSVTGEWNADKTGITGEFGFGAKVMDAVSAKFKEEGIDIAPPDLQAIAWFAEKELWGTNNWTTVAGEGGSFEENIEAMPVERYAAGVSIQQGEAAPSAEDLAAAKDRLAETLSANPGVVAIRVMPTKGLYGNTVETSFDMEWVVDKGQFDVVPVLSDIAKVAKENNQLDIFVSRVINPEDKNPNARPGVEIYFKNQRALDAAKPILEKFTEKEQDGFTMIVDPRSKVPGKYIGVRLQYVPEISMRFDPALRQKLLEPGVIEAELVTKAEILDDIANDVAKMEGVAYAKVVEYDTLVIGEENYDAFIDRKVTSADSATGGNAWFGQPVRTAVERAVARYEGNIRPSRRRNIPAGQQTQVRTKSLESIFEGLNGRGLALARAQAAADAHPAAAQITFVQDNFYDILAQLEESGRVEINCD